MNRLLTVAVALCVFSAVFAIAESITQKSLSDDSHHLNQHNTTKKYRPVVLLHGLFNVSAVMHDFAEWLRNDFPGIYVLNVELDTGKDKMFSLLEPMHKQLEILNEKITADPNLKDGFDMIGHSQGALLTRAWLVKYNSPVCNNYISLAGPQQGIYGVPELNAYCPDDVCPQLAKWMSAQISGKDSEFWQTKISFAQYWKNPFNLTQYLDTNAFLADVNNEKAVKNATYKANFIKTTGKMIYVKAEYDHIVVPKETEHWGFFEPGSETKMFNFTESPTYKGDWIGLKTLDKRGQIEFKSVPCGHQPMTLPGCKGCVYDDIVKKYTGTLLP